MTIVTAEEITRFRSELADHPEALEALDIIEECKGNLEDAAEVLAVRVGSDMFREKNDEDEWFKKFIKKLCPIICTEEFENAFLNGSFAVIVTALSTSTMAPAIVITPAVLYISHKTWKKFCEDCLRKDSLPVAQS